MKRLMLNRCVLVWLLMCGSGAIAVGDGDGKRYPPYPAIWGYELPYAAKGDRDSQIVLYKMEEGDIYITYVDQVRLIRRSDGKRDVAFRANGLSFFSGGKRIFTKEELNAFGAKYHNRRIQYGGAMSIAFRDGSSIRRVSVADNVCYSSFPFHIEKKDAKGNVVAKESLLYLYDSPIRQESRSVCDEGVGTEVGERASARPMTFIPLEDDTFLVHEEGGNYILRLDKNFSTEYPLNNHLFVIDTEIIEKLKAKFGNSGFPKAQQQVNDAVAEYLLQLKGRTTK